LITLGELKLAFGSLQLPQSVAGLGADAVYAQIDPYYTGQVAIADFVDGMTVLVAKAATATAPASNLSDGELLLQSFYANDAAS